MSKKFLLKLKNYTKKNFKISSNFKIYPGGHYVSKTGLSRYYLTTDYYGETSNTITSQLHHVISSIYNASITQIHFVFDNHSTNKNFIVLLYLDYLVFSFNTKFGSIFLNLPL